MYRSKGWTPALLLMALLTTQSTTSHAAIVETIVGPTSLPPGAPPVVTKDEAKGRVCVQLSRVVSGQATLTSSVSGKRVELGPNMCGCITPSGETLTFECYSSILPAEMTEATPPLLFIPATGFTPPPCVSPNAPTCR